MLILLLSCTQTPVTPPAPTAAPAGAEPPAPPEWSALLHVDTLTELGDRGVGFDDPGLEAGLPALQAGGANVVVEVIWPPRDSDHEPFTFAELGQFERAIAGVSDRMVLARDPAQADAAIRGGKVAALLALEGAHGIEQDGVDGLRRLHDHGLAMVGLAWSMSNRFAGSSGDRGGGLTADGKALVAAAQRLGVLVDVSHASRQATLDACAITEAPLVASHSGAASVLDVPRNLSDEEIRCIAASGGVVGVNFHADFVARSPVGIAQVADQVDALVRTAGIDHVAVGSDWDGDIHVPSGLESAAKLPDLWTELRRRGYDDGQIAAIRGGNFRRAWTAALAGAH